MRYCIVIYILFFLSLSLQAQSKFGNATLDELNMTSYEQDTTASAVILNKDMEISFSYIEHKGFVFDYTEKVKIKILKKDGLSFADQEINYYKKNGNLEEEVRELSAMSYNLDNGKIVKTKMSKSNVFQEQDDKKYNKTKFAIPGAKVGSVIEYKYTVRSPFLYNLSTIEFQSTIPIMYIKCEAKIPEYLIYNVSLRGYSPLKVALKEKVRETISLIVDGKMGRHNCIADHYTYIGENMPATKDEPYLWCLDDHITKNTFELQRTQLPGSFPRDYSSSWENIDATFAKNKDFGGNVKKEVGYKE